MSKDDLYMVYYKSNTSFFPFLFLSRERFQNPHFLAVLEDCSNLIKIRTGNPDAYENVSVHKSHIMNNGTYVCI